MAQAAVALDGYLAVFGWRLVTANDVDGKALVELPDLLLRSITADNVDTPHPVDPDLRARVSMNSGFGMNVTE